QPHLPVRHVPPAAHDGGNRLHGTDHQREVSQVPVIIEAVTALDARQAGKAPGGVTVNVLKGAVIKYAAFPGVLVKGKREDSPAVIVPDVQAAVFTQLEPGQQAAQVGQGKRVDQYASGRAVGLQPYPTDGKARLVCPIKK